MTGPEHYRRAEACMDAAEAMAAPHRGKSMSAAQADALRGDFTGTLIAALVHATLANAAAAAGQNPTWHEVLKP